MPNDTLVNARSPVTKKSNGTVIAGPDVCKTPVGPSVIPIPYVNISKSGDLAKGSKNVSFNGAPVCLKGSEFSTSTGDEPGTLKGLISSTNKGKTFPAMQSFNVKIEGEGVVRNVDPFIANNRNTLPIPLMQAQTTPAVIPLDETVKCPYCKKNAHLPVKAGGTSAGSGKKLRRNIVTDSKLKTYRWYTGEGSLQAHHLICSSAMQTDDWPQWCYDFGYDINRKLNGVMLPGHMDLACQLHAPLHKSNHDKAKAGGMVYPERIGRELKEFSEDIRTGKYCQNPNALTEKLDNLSLKILGKIDLFRWRLTEDGLDYKFLNNGCAGVKAIPGKPQCPCPDGRLHNIKDHTGTVIPINTSPLVIGT